MRYRLGLDVGTASTAGVTAYLDQHGRETALTGWGYLRTFDESTTTDSKGRPKSKRANRRSYRLSGRQHERGAGALRNLASLAPLMGLEEKELTADSGQNLPRLRALAARSEVSLVDLFSIFLRIAKKRGYYGAFRADIPKKGKTAEADQPESDPTDTPEPQDGSFQKASGEVRGGSQALAHVIAVRAQALRVPDLTLGEYLFDRLQRGLPSKLKIKMPGGKKTSSKVAAADLEDSNLYALNEMVRWEFHQIWNTQEKFHPQLTGSEPDGRSLRHVFEKAIFFKRPLKSWTDKIGKCPLEPNHVRAAKATPVYQEFRIEKLLSDLRWGIGPRAQSLTPLQKSIIRNLLNSQKDIRWTSIYEHLEKAGAPRPAGRGLNIAQRGADRLTGNTTLAAIRRMGGDVEAAWNATSKSIQNDVLTFLAELGSPEQLLEPNWPEQFVVDGTPRRFEVGFVKFINALTMLPKFDRLSAMGFESGRCGYSLQALEKMTTWMREPVFPVAWPEDARIADEDRARRVLYPASGIQTPLRAKLPPPPETGNHVVDVALRQIALVVHKCIRHHQEMPDEIIVELGREMTQGLSARTEAMSIIKNNETQREAAIAALQGDGNVPTTGAVNRYLLAQEQLFVCPYCQDRNRLSNGMIADGSATNSEHILPKGLTSVRRKRSELMVAHTACNDAKADRTPWQAWGHGSADQDDDRWRAVEEMAEGLRARATTEKDRSVKKRLTRKAHLLLLRDFESEVLTDDSVASFADSQMHHTAWIAKDIALWLKSICAKVFVARGELTARLRSEWALNTVIPEIRFQEGRTVHATGINNKLGLQISFEDFTKFRPTWESRARGTDAKTGLKLEKRHDNRHHLVDAAVIALSGRSLYQQVATHYKLADEMLRAGQTHDPRGKRIFRWRLPRPPFDGLRNQISNLVQNAPHSHKTDRYSTGGFFGGWAYSAAEKEGVAYLTTRVALIDLIDKNRPERTRSAIEQLVVSAETRRHILQAFDERIQAGEPPKVALSRPVKMSGGYGTDIWKVKIFQKSAGNPGAGDLPLIPIGDRTFALQLKPGKNQKSAGKKFLLHDGYAFLARFKDPEKSHFVDLESAKPIFAECLRFKSVNCHQIFRGDTVMLASDTEKWLIHQIRQGGELAIAPLTEAGTWLQIQKRGGKARSIGTKDVLALRVI